MRSLRGALNVSESFVLLYPDAATFTHPFEELFDCRVFLRIRIDYGWLCSPTFVTA